MRAHLVLALALVGLSLPACSALGLDHLPQADCVQGSGGLAGDPFCASLADRIPPPDHCTTWQCNGDTRHCEELPRDDDQDGVPGTTYMDASGMFMCTPTGPTDCDDTATGGDDFPNHAETCDGLDQDCDGVPDDGALNVGMPTVITTVNAGQDQSLFVSQIDADEAFLVARYSAVYRAFTIGNATPNDLVFSQTGSGPITPQGFDGAVTAIGHGRYALVTRRTTTCPQWSIFPVDSGMAPVTLRAGDETLMPACPSSGTQVLSAPAIAALPVTLGGATFDTRGTATNRVSTEVVTLGSSVGDGPPVVVALADAFVVAYPRADATIAVHLATVTADAAGVHVMASTTPDYVEPAGSSVPQSVTLAVGPTDSGVSTIALAYTTGCTGENPITVRMLTRSGAMLMGSSTPTTMIGTGATRTLVRVVYQPRASEWVVSWRSGMTLAAQRLFHDGGALEGDPFTVVMPATFPAYVIEPLATSGGPLYRVLLINGTSLSQSTFGCAAGMR